MEVWTPFTIKMSTVKDYEIVTAFVNKLFSTDEFMIDCKYDKSNLSIFIEDELADEYDIVFFADIFSDLLCKCADNQQNPEIKKALESVCFVIQGHTSYGGCGEDIDFIIEKKAGIISVGTTCNYYSYCAFSDYKEFCDELEYSCPNVREIISEDEFDPKCEYRVSTHGDIFTADTVEYEYTTHFVGKLNDPRSSWREDLKKALLKLPMGEVYDRVSEICTV